MKKCQPTPQGARKQMKRINYNPFATATTPVQKDIIEFASENCGFNLATGTAYFELPPSADGKHRTKVRINLADLPRLADFLTTFKARSDTLATDLREKQKIAALLAAQSQ